MVRPRHAKLALLQAALAALLAPRASAEQALEPVVVVVESPADTGLDGDAVRRAVGVELDEPVIGPSDPGAAAAAHVLVVSVDKARICMILRARDGEVTARQIDASADRAARLRDIAWLAGNLLRDQVSPIVGRPATEPPHPTAPPPNAAPVASVAAQAEPAVRPARAQWELSVLSGPAFAPNYEGNEYSSTTQIDVQRRAPGRTLVLGVALQIGHNFAGDTVHVFGADAFLGKEWRGSRGFGEVAAGFGIEAARPLNGAASNGPSCPVTGPCPAFDVRAPGLAALPFFRATATAGVAITARLDLALRIGGQFSGNGLFDSTASVTAGLRWRVL
jgi:hypothetical protein